MQAMSVIPALPAWQNSADVAGGTGKNQKLEDIYYVCKSCDQWFR